MALQQVPACEWLRICDGDEFQLPILYEVGLDHQLPVWEQYLIDWISLMGKRERWL